MGVRTTIETPEALHAELRRRARQTGATMRSLILAAIDQTYPPVTKRKKNIPVTDPMITGKGKRGPLFPVDENPHDFIFS